MKKVAGKTRINPPVTAEMGEWFTAHTGVLPVLYFEKEAEKNEEAYRKNKNSG